MLCTIPTNASYFHSFRNDIIKANTKYNMCYSHFEILHLKYMFDGNISCISREYGLFSYIHPKKRVAV